MEGCVCVEMLVLTSTKGTPSLLAVLVVLWRCVCVKMLVGPRLAVLPSAPALLYSHLCTSKASKLSTWRGAVKVCVEMLVHLVLQRCLVHALRCQYLHFALVKPVNWGGRSVARHTAAQASVFVLLS